jgi:hypothetical protein
LRGAATGRRDAPRARRAPCHHAEACQACRVRRAGPGSCHDDANDPGFEFELQERIERQRHGTTEPGTGKPKQTTAWQASDASPPTHSLALGDAGLSEARNPQ